MQKKDMKPSSPTKRSSSFSSQQQQQSSPSNHCAQHQQAFDSQSLEDDLLSAADLLQSPGSTGYYYNYEQDNLLDSTPPPIVGPPSDYEYSEDFADMVKRIVNKHRLPSISSLPEATTSQEQHQEEEEEANQSSSGESSRNVVEKGERASNREVEETSADSLQVQVEAKSAATKTKRGESNRKKEEMLTVEQGRRENHYEEEEIDASALGLPPIDELSNEDESFKQMLARIVNQHPRSPTLQSPNSSADSQDDLIKSLLNFEEEDDDDNNNAAAVPTLPNPFTNNDNNDQNQRVENARRYSRNILSQELIQNTSQDSLNEPLLLTNYSILDNIHPWLYNNGDDVYGSPLAALHLPDPVEEEEAQQERNYISRHARSVNDFDYISQRQWSMEQQHQQQQEEAFTRLSVSPQPAFPHRLVRIQASPRRGGVLSPRYRTTGAGSGGNSQKSSGDSYKQSSSSQNISPASSSNSQGKDDTWKTEEFTRWLNWDSKDEMIRGTSFIEERATASGGTAKGKEKATFEEDVESYELFDESEPGNDFLERILAGGGYKTPLEVGVDESPISDIEKYIIATSTPKKDAEIMRKELAEAGGSSSNMPYRQPQRMTRKLSASLSPLKPFGLTTNVDELLESEEFGVGSRDIKKQQQQQQRKRPIELAPTSPTRGSPQRRRIQSARSSNFSPRTHTNENAKATTARDIANKKEEKKEPFEFRTRRKAVEKDNVSPVVVSKPDKKDSKGFTPTTTSTERRRKLISSLDDDENTSDKKPNPSSPSKQQSCKGNK